MNRSLITCSLLLLLALVGCTPENFGGPEPLEDALTGEIYLLPEGTAKLPDFSQLESIGTIYTTSLDIPARNFSEGFPGITDRFEWFGLQYKGILQIKTPGSYTFELSSDDGSKLYIGSQLVIDNDGLHRAQAGSFGTTLLSAGNHPLTLEYFQGPKYEIALQFFITPPAQASQIFDSTVVY